jgi:hypothetical protein
LLFLVMVMPVPLLITSGEHWSHWLCQPEWPSPHDCTHSIWNELKFIPIIGSITCIEVGSNFFSLAYFNATHKIIYSIAQAFKTPTTYPRPIKNPKPCCHSRAKVMLQNIVLQKQCWSVATEDNVA